VAGQQKLEVEGCEPSEPCLVELLRVDFRLSLCEEFIVVLPENRKTLRGNGFEPLAMKMVYEFTSELVEPAEVAVELVVTVSRPDEAAVAEQFEDLVNSVAVVVAARSEVGDGSGLVEVIEDFERFCPSIAPGSRCGSVAGRCPGRVRPPERPTGRPAFGDRRVPCRRAPFDEVADGTGEVARCGRASSRLRRSCRRLRQSRGTSSSMRRSTM